MERFRTLLKHGGFAVLLAAVCASFYAFGYVTAEDRYLSQQGEASDRIRQLEGRLRNQSYALESIRASLDSEIELTSSILPGASPARTTPAVATK